MFSSFLITTVLDFKGEHWVLEHSHPELITILYESLSWLMNIYCFQTSYFQGFISCNQVKIDLFKNNSELNKSINYWLSAVT